MKSRISTVIISLLTGLVFGWLLFHSPRKDNNSADQAAKTEKVSEWTCAMHPQIRMAEQGKCPICGMDLVPVAQSDISTIDPSAVHLSKEALALANVETSTGTKKMASKDVRLYGKVQADERLLQSQVAYVPGRIEKLYVNFTGESVVKGQVLAQIYSSALITAQMELLETAKTKQTQPGLYEASKEKLRLLKITDNQIEKIEESGVVTNNFEVVSNTTGTVTDRRVSAGDYVSPGTVLFEIADLSKVWVMFDAYESDLSFLHEGAKIAFTLQSLPDMHFSGIIAFIDPFIDPVTRVAKVRVEAKNHSGELKPEMFATGLVSAILSRHSDNLVIPKSAVLWTGKRSIVYVREKDSGEPVFKIREIELGPVLDDNVVITDGLTEGEEIVTNSTFSIDAAAQLAGKPSLMNGVQPVVSAETQTSFRVSGNCDMCRERIEKAAMSVNGVASAAWDSKTQMIAVGFESNRTDIAAIEKAISKVGHDTEHFRADDVTYESLPECCLYRK